MTLPSFLRRMFSVDSKARERRERRGARNKPTQPIARDALKWRKDTGDIPIPDWHATARSARAPKEDAPVVEADAFWGGAARTWLDALAAQWGSAYAVMESPEFMLLAALPPNLRAATLGYAENTRRRVLDALPGIANDEGYGKTIILVVHSVARYYEYVSHYYGDDEGQKQADGSNELSMSGGMFINDGYGHFVFVAEEDMRRIEGTIAHELTHSLVRHLPIPCWLNEGIAVGVERTLCGHHSTETVQELHGRHAAYWNERTIQEFWSGKSWLRPGDSNELSYALATTLVQLAGHDWNAFVRFVNAAHADDAGESAAIEHLDHALADFLTPMLGDGDWSPHPERWRDGVEAGGFARVDF